MSKMKKMILVLGMAIVFVACSKENNGGTTNVVSTVTVKDLPADTIIGITPGAPPTGGFPYGAGRFTFFSLESNKIVPASDSASNKWDLAFKGTTIATNSGNSGPGGAGAFVFVGLFDDLKTIPADSSFRIDNAPTAFAIPTGSNRAWYAYDGINQLVNPIPGRVLVIRTASGKYAKVEILNYYKGGVTPATTAPDAVKLSTQRYYTFRYTFQPNGTKTF
ncbi:HmuY family protein [Sediminibacterium sp. TEGAF015]|uniref:HmuY family protein n=1 Tax=Sediminibacterium sp. TEGAF015 TaxID=575378 RepID=UPI0021FE6C15|nr:HmuY family protein [Sediminibacterium sp. TEGAF015]BDQ12158.1 hypothetical protein TEGAF0_13750 [Sediminibacterium sp. TEGAF015]